MKEYALLSNDYNNVLETLILHDRDVDYKEHFYLEQKIRIKEYESLSLVDIAHGPRRIRKGEEYNFTGREEVYEIIDIHEYYDLGDGYCRDFKLWQEN